MHFLLALQRSGTNMLRGVLNSHPQINALPEVFNDRSGQERLMEFSEAPYFNTYLLKKIRENPENGLGTARPKIVQDYFEMLLETFTSQEVRAIVDVKYNSLHNANNSWQRPSTPPKMVVMIKNQGFPVIFLRRRNKLAVVLSLLRSKQTQVYHVMEPENLVSVKMTVDPEAVINLANIQKDQDELVTRWIKQVGVKNLELYYEDLFVGEPGSELDPRVFESIGSYLSIDPTLFDLTPQMIRVSQGYRKEIENFDELEAALKNTQYHKDFVAG